MNAVTPPTVGRPRDPAAVRSLTFDDVTVTYVVDGVLTMRPEKFFPETPRAAWAELCTPAGDLLMSAGGLLVRIAGTTVLIDAGVGTMTTSFTLGSVDCGSMLDVWAHSASAPRTSTCWPSRIFTSTMPGGPSPTAPRRFRMPATCWRLRNGRRT